MSIEQFSLRWDNYYKNMSCGMNHLLANEDLVDVTIAIDGQYLKAHKMILSVCSPYFKTLFSVNPCKHPIVFMKDISYSVMKDLLMFMYQGEVQVNQDHLDIFIKTAEALEIKGLAGDNKHEKDTTEKVKIKRPIHQNKLKTITKQSTPILTKKMKFSPPTEDMEATIMTPPIDSQILIKPEFVSTTNMIGDCVDLKIEPCDINPEDEVNDDLVTAIREEELNERKDYLMEGVNQMLAGTSAESMGDSIQDCGPLIAYPHELKETEKRCKRNRKVRRRCTCCYKQLAWTLGWRVAVKSTKRVVTYCDTCPDKPFLCIQCFSTHF